MNTSDVCECVCIKMVMVLMLMHLSSRSLRMALIALEVISVEVK